MGEAPKHFKSFLYKNKFYMLIMAEILGFHVHLLLSGMNFGPFIARSAR